MSIFPAPRRLNVFLPGDAETPSASIDLFPHRVTPRQGNTHDDILLWLASVAFRYVYRAGAIADGILLEIYTHGLNAPFARIEKGAIAVSYDPVADDQLHLRVTEDGIRLPDGTEVPKENFCAPMIYEPRLERHRPDWLKGDRQWVADNLRGQVILALSAAALPCGLDYRETGNRISAIYGRMARLLSLNYAPGAAGSASATSDARQCFSKYIENWLAEPDRIYSPTQLQPTPDMKQMVCDLVPADILEMAKAAWSAAQGPDGGPLSQACKATRGEKLGTTNHEGLQLHQSIRRIDQAIESAARMDLLKPAARRRQEKLRKA